MTDIVEQKCGDVAGAWGPKAEVYRCEYCKTLYLPNDADPKVNLAGAGMASVFGLTVAPKPPAALKETVSKEAVPAKEPVPPAINPVSLEENKEPK